MVSGVVRPNNPMLLRPVGYDFAPSMTSLYARRKKGLIIWILQNMQYVSDDTQWI